MSSPSRSPCAFAWRRCSSWLPPIWGSQLAIVDQRRTSCAGGSGAATQNSKLTARCPSGRVWRGLSLTLTAGLDPESTSSPRGQTITEGNEGNEGRNKPLSQHLRYLLCDLSEVLFLDAAGLDYHRTVRQTGETRNHPFRPLLDGEAPAQRISARLGRKLCAVKIIDPDSASFGPGSILAR